MARVDVCFLGFECIPLFALRHQQPPQNVHDFVLQPSSILSCLQAFQDFPHILSERPMGCVQTGTLVHGGTDTYF